MCRPTERFARTIAVAVTLGTMLAGCSDLYYDRRDTIALSGGNAVAANEIAQMVDPWPPHSGNTNIATNGQKMQSAVERYRTNKVTPPVNPTTLDITNPQQATPAPTTTQPTAANGNGSPTTTTSTQISSQ
jgi:hypothetical protein